MTTDQASKLRQAVIDAQRAVKALTPSYAARELQMALYAFDRAVSAIPPDYEKAEVQLAICRTLIGFVDAPFSEVISVLVRCLRKAQRALRAMLGEPAVPAEPAS